MRFKSASSGVFGHISVIMHVCTLLGHVNSNLQCLTQAQKKELFHQTQVSGWKDYPRSLNGILPVMSVDPLVANAGRDSMHHVYLRKDNWKKSRSKWYLRSVKSGMYQLLSTSPALPFCVRQQKNGGMQSKYGTNVGTVEEKG